MEQRELVSIILPTYNRAHTLAQTIRSVCAQTYENWELIVVDDGSTDDTRALLASFAADARIRPVYLEQNGNVCVALNEGIAHMRGDYMARIDSDDLWLPEKLEKQIAYLRAHPDCGACFTQVDLIDAQDECVNARWPALYEAYRPDCKTQREWVLRLLQKGNCLCQSTAVIPRAVLQAVGTYNLALLQSQDYDLWLRIAARYPIYLDPQPLTRYRWEPEESIKLSRSGEESDTRFYNEQRLIRLHFLDLIRDEDFLRLFGPDCIRPEARTPLELECEKMLWCLRAGGDMRLAGVMRAERLLAQEEARRMLEQVYQFTPKDLYRASKEHLWYDTVLQRRYADMQHACNLQGIEANQCQQQLAACTEQLREQREQCAQLRAALQACQQSTSWKVTKPLRALSRLLHRSKAADDPTP